MTDGVTGMETHGSPLQSAARVSSGGRRFPLIKLIKAIFAGVYNMHVQKWPILWAPKGHREQPRAQHLESRC